VSWRPRFQLTGASISDDLGPDAEGFSATFEWLGCIVEFVFCRRGKQ